MLYSGDHFTILKRVWVQYLSTRTTQHLHIDTYTPARSIRRPHPQRLHRLHSHIYTCAPHPTSTTPPPQRLAPVRQRSYVCTHWRSYSNTCSSALNLFALPHERLSGERSLRNQIAAPTARCVRGGISWLRFIQVPMASSLADSTRTKLADDTLSWRTFKSRFNLGNLLDHG